MARIESFSYSTLKGIAELLSDKYRGWEIAGFLHAIGFPQFQHDGLSSKYTFTLNAFNTIQGSSNGTSAIAKLMENICDPRGSDKTGDELRLAINDLLKPYGALVNEQGKLVDIVTGVAVTYGTSDHGDSATLPERSSADKNRDVFIVHGHDEAAKEAVARFIEKLDLHAIILHEQPDGGRTIIEKFEQYSDVGFAVVLLTADDVGAPHGKQDELKPRARQNVVFELGYFIGKLSRRQVCALYKGDVEIFSDFQGILHVPMDAVGSWKMKLAQELKAAGIKLDTSSLLG